MIEMKRRTTIKELCAILKIDISLGRNLIKLMLLTGAAKNTGEKKKRAIVYEIPQTISFDLTNELKPIAWNQCWCMKRNCCVK